jgi:hypothetical protein
MPPLDRFWHKHYSSARHIPRNIADQWGLSRGGAGNEGLDRLIDDAVNKLGDTPGALASYIAHELVVGGYEKRALRSDPRQREAKLTGNWIILGKHGGQRYYLALATHEAGERPFHLYDSLVKSCAAEFPFLFE